MRLFDFFKPRNKHSLSYLEQLRLKQYTQLLNDDALQNALYPQQWCAEILRGEICDELSEASGEFGLEAGNPIPVNGPIGEICYLSRLRLAESGQAIFFHRIGLVGPADGKKVDIYEYGSWDGMHWGFLFLDMYHPVKSKKAPCGFYLLEENILSLHGINVYVPDFPDKLVKVSNKHSKFLFGMKLASPLMERSVSWDKLSVPLQHKQQAEKYRQTVSEVMMAAP